MNVYRRSFYELSIGMYIRMERFIDYDTLMTET